MDQTLHLRGANFKVNWTLTEADRPGKATWEGRGPAHSYARTSYSLREVDGGKTRFEYENEFKAPGGFLGAAASRMLIGGVPEREAKRSLQRLKALLEKGGRGWGKMTPRMAWVGGGATARLMSPQLTEGAPPPARRTDMDRIVTDEMVPALE